MRNRSEQTICAVSTPPGVGGIGVIRISGSEALTAARKIAPSLTKKTIRSHHLYFSQIKDENAELIDEVVISFFEHGKSFTGEEVVEISCHGSEYISAKILELLVNNGCALAEKGEFTFRAFMNDRIDLIQAESVLSLIESQSEASARIALRQLKGHISKKFFQLESDLTWCLAHIEASIDFSTEGIEVVDPAVLLQKLVAIECQLRTVTNSYRSGRLIKEGIKVVFLGKPNAGKSSLLNLISEDEKAIVTAIAGTTRDIIQATTLREGLRFTLSDTAGLRETQDEIELIGVERSHKEASRADIVLYVLDLTDLDWHQVEDQIRQIKSPFIILLNKSDLISERDRNSNRKKLQNLLPELDDKEVLLTSHLDPTARDRVLTAVRQKLGQLNPMDEAMITSARQYEMSQYALEMLRVSINELQKDMGAEFIAMYLKEALISIQRILGLVFDDQIMDRVFKEFCLGK